MARRVRGICGGLLLLLVLLAGVWYVLRSRAMAGQAAPGGAPTQPPVVPVVATAAARRDVPIYLDGLGTVQAYNTVTVHSQIDGQLTRIAFKEGQDVHKGDVLAEIDPRSYQAQLEQAQAKKKQDQAKELQDRGKVLQDQAKKAQDEAFEKQSRAKKALDEVTLANARLNLKRYQDTLASGGSSEQNVTDAKMLVGQTEALIVADDAGIQASQAAIQADDAALQADQAAIQADQATVQADDAAINYAQTFLSYTVIASPIDGRVGVRLIDAGNIVHANDQNGIVVVTQLQPISMIFTLPQQDLSAVNGRLAQEPLPVLAVDGDGKTQLDRGTLQLVDNQIDTTTGTMRLKATFPNAQRKLWPGGFVNVRLLLDTRRDATVVAAPAVQHGPDGIFVYLIKPDETVEVRPVSVALIQDGEAVIASGINPSDMVVLSGQDRLKAGTRVVWGKPKGDGGAKPESDGAATPKSDGGVKPGSPEEKKGKRPTVSSQ